VPRRADEALAQRDGVFELLVQRSRLQPGRDGVPEAMGVVELPAVAVEQVRTLAGADPVQVRPHRLVVRERLAVRAGALGLARGARADGEDRLDVARLDGVVHHARGLGPWLGAQRPDDRGVQGAPPQGGNAALDRPPRELVAEREAVGTDLDDAGGLRLGERVDLRPEQLGCQLEAHVRGHDRELVERRAAGLAQPPDARARPPSRWRGRRREARRAPR
jgi:hypothetical protein